MAAQKYINFKTERGVAKYPKLDQAYSFSQAKNRSMPDPDGQYELTLVMTPKDAKEMKELVNKAIAESGIKPSNLPFKKEIDKDTGEETGNIEVKMKAYGKKKDGSKNLIRFFDAKLNPMPSNFPLTSGSVVRAEGWISIAKLGARLNLRTVQVLSLAERTSAFSAEDGFEFDGSVEADHNETNDKTNSPEQKADNEDFDF